MYIYSTFKSDNIIVSAEKTTGGHMYDILAIEDDPIIRAAFNRVLQPEGYKLTLAENGVSGLQACILNKPDLVLMDVHLPDGNGIELCRKIKADPRVRHIPVFIITGEAVTVENRMEGFDSGADDYILKPFSPEELILRIRRILK